MLTIYQRLVPGYVLLLALLVGAGLDNTKSLRRAALSIGKPLIPPSRQPKSATASPNKRGPGSSPEPFSAFWSQPVFSSPSSVPYTGWR